MDVAKSISEGFARNVISASFDGTTVENQPFDDGRQSYIIPGMTKAEKKLWHSTSHVCARFLRKCILESN
jgi:threonyl-tRNA synthetase